MPDKLCEVIGRVLGLAPDDVTDELQMGKSDVWDSLKHMDMVVSIEEEFSVDLTADDIVAMQSVGEIRNVLARRGVGQ